MEKLTELYELLNEKFDNVFHVETINEGFPRIVYTEIGREYEFFDNVPYYGKWIVAIDLYTQKEFDPIFGELEELLKAQKIPFAIEHIEHGTLQDKNKKSFQGVTWYRFICEVM